MNKINIKKGLEKITKTVDEKVIDSKLVDKTQEIIDKAEQKITETYNNPVVQDAITKGKEKIEKTYNSVPVQMAVGTAKTIGNIFLKKIQKGYEKLHETLEQKAETGDGLAGTILKTEEKTKTLYTQVLDIYSGIRIGGKEKEEILPGYTSMIKAYIDECDKDKTGKQNKTYTKNLEEGINMIVDKTNGLITIKTTKEDKERGVYIQATLETENVNPKEFSEIMQQLSLDAHTVFGNDQLKDKGIKQYNESHDLDLKLSGSKEMKYNMNATVADSRIVIAYKPVEMENAKMTMMIEYTLN